MKISADWLEASATQKVYDLLGDQTYAVGGCVRNTLLNQPVADIDIATHLSPDEVVRRCKEANIKCVPTGIEHGTVTIVPEKNTAMEVTAFRKDVATDGRRAVVAFASTLEEDAQRRDFTMNALYVARSGELLDPVNGLQDIETRTIRFIGNAAQRIREDYLRILRFFRFFAWYADPKEGLEPDGLAACAEGVEGLEKVSAERIGAEMRKLLLAPDPSQSIAAMEASGVLGKVLPGASARDLNLLTFLEFGAPRFERRAASLGGQDIADHWRLSKGERLEIGKLRELIGTSVGLPEIAYRHGKEIAEDVAMLRSMSFETPLPKGLNEDIELGISASFPLSAKDLMAHFQGPELGEQLRLREARWIASGFSLTKVELL